jgi:drug/metabolite transporter (DMT)-like permease
MSLNDPLLEESKNEPSKDNQHKSDYSAASSFLLVNSFEFIASSVVAISQFSTQTLGVTILEFAFTRTVCNLLVAILTCVYKQIGAFEGITSDMWWPLFWRCLLGNIGFVSVVYTFKHLPVTIGTVIIAMSPFAVALMASCFLNDQVETRDIIAIGISFIGIILIANSK